LAPLPTPLVPAERLGRAVGLPGLWLKRDDLIAFGFGGNKVRGLEFLIADALAQHASVIVTGAGTQSNHVRASAAAAAAADLETIAVYWGAPPATLEGNAALTQLLGAELRFTGDDDRTSVDRELDAVAAGARDAGRRPYVIPRGGACALGVAGHVLAVAELEAQCRDVGIEPDAIVLAVGSGGTYAGWLAGIRALGLRWRLEGFTVSRPVADVRRTIAELATAGAALAGIPASFGEAEATVHDGFIGGGYGIPTAEADAAIELAARTDGVFFDPTYTGKAFAGLMDHALLGRFRADETVVFVHTGGQPTLLARRVARA
jgi:1-aminocyclopropane-1-carboxylate deaminase/D-cysteine desulfhydrase-like pyridoxal-dependent ACC family enzyme